MQPRVLLAFAAGYVSAVELAVQSWKDAECTSSMLNMPCCEGYTEDTWPGEAVTAGACATSFGWDYENPGMIFSCRSGGGWEITIDSSYGTTAAECGAPAPTVTCEVGTEVPQSFDGEAVDTSGPQGLVVRAVLPKGCKIVGESSDSCVTVINVPQGGYTDYGDYVVAYKVSGCPDPPEGWLDFLPFGLGGKIGISVGGGTVFVGFFCLMCCCWVPSCPAAKKREAKRQSQKQQPTQV